MVKKTQQDLFVYHLFSKGGEATIEEMKKVTDGYIYRITSDLIRRGLIKKKVEIVGGKSGVPPRKKITYRINNDRYAQKRLNKIKNKF